MKKKILAILLFSFALTSLAYAEDDGMDVLNRMRSKIEKEDKAKAKAQQEAEEQTRKEAEAQAKVFQEQQSTMATVDTVPVVTNAVTMNAEEQKDAMDILDRMRAKIEKEEAEKAKLAAEARELGISPSEVASMDNVEAMIEAKKAAETKPKTEAEKLERIRKKAMDKLDFYERVVRSVAREEAEVAAYYEIMGEEKARPSIMDERNAEFTEQTSPAEVQQ